MKKYEIRLDTMTDLNKFLEVAHKIAKPDLELKLKNDVGECVSPYSLLGLMYASSEFSNCYLYSNKEIYDSIKDFII